LPAGTRDQADQTMTHAATILPEIASGHAETVRAVIDCRRGGFTPRELEELIAAGNHLAGLIVGIGDVVKVGLEDGGAVATLLPLCERAAAAQARALAMCQAVRDEAQKAVPDPRQVPEGFTEFLRAIEFAEQAHERVLSFGAWLRSPRPQVGPAALGDSSGPPGAEGYESSDSVLARLQAGGEL
jgi:hypothetical protein